MKDELKSELEVFVQKRIQVLKRFHSTEREVKRVVLYSTIKLGRDSEIEILHYAHNRFLNQQFKIDHPEIKVVIVRAYNPKREYLETDLFPEVCKQEGDYGVDVGKYLRERQII